MQVAETTAPLTGVRLLEPSTLGGFFFFGGAQIGLQNTAN